MNEVLGPGPGENLLQMDLVGGRIFELHCFDTPLTPAKLDIMGHELHKAGCTGENLRILVCDQHDIGMLTGFRCWFEGKEPHSAFRMQYRGVEVQISKKVPPTEVHFTTPDRELLGKLVALKPGFVNVPQRNHDLCV